MIRRFIFDRVDRIRVLIKMPGLEKGILLTNLLVLAGFLSGFSGQSRNVRVIVSENDHTIGRYDIYELTLTHRKKYANPWEDVRIAATFTAPSGKEYQVGGFFYDVNTWKVRFAPNETGDWIWFLAFESGSGRFAQEGGLTCVDSHRSGFLRIHPQNPYRLMTEGNGRAFYPLGFNHGVYDKAGAFGLGPADGTLDFDWTMDADKGVPIDRFFRAFAAAGINLFRMNTETDTYPPYESLSDLNYERSGRNTYSMTAGKLTDQLAAEIHKFGMKFFMVLMGDPRFGVNLSDPTAKQALLNYLRYFINRWGAYVDIWELANEESVLTAPDEYVNAVAEFIKGYDPYHHLVTISLERPTLSGIELNSPHRYHGYDTLGLNKLLADDFDHNKSLSAKPLIYGEFGNGPPYAIGDGEGRYRIFIWTAMFNEASLVFWDYGREKNYVGGAIYIGSEERAETKVFTNFIADFDPLARPISVQCSPASEIRADALGSARDIGVYFSHLTSHSTVLSGAQATLDIPQDGMRGVWVDPVTGNTLGSVILRTGRQTLAVPDFRFDIALRILRAGANMSPSAYAGPDQKVIDADGDAEESVILNALRSYDPDGKIVAYVWKEGSTQVGAGVAPWVSLPVGRHVVTLVVTDDQGATDQDSMEITVKPADAPVITVTAPHGGEVYRWGEKLSVIWKSKNYQGNVRILTNHGGDRWTDSAASVPNTGHWTTTIPDLSARNYPTSGWKVRVMADKNIEPADESDGTFMILSPDAGPPPSAEVIADPSFGNAPLTVNFRGRLLTDANGTSTSFVWDFGDLQTGNQLNVSHTYKMPGTYTATLTAAAESGGKDSKSITVYVLPPGVRLPADIVPH
jgi:hypothetical protein